MRMEGIGDFVAKNTLEFLLTHPTKTFPEYDSEVELVLERTNTGQLLPCSAVAAAAMVKDIMPQCVQVAHCGLEMTVELPLHRYVSARRVQLNACKLCQVEKP